MEKEVKSQNLHEMAPTQGFQLTTEEFWSLITLLLAFLPHTISERTHRKKLSPSIDLDCVKIKTSVFPS